MESTISVAWIIIVCLYYNSLLPYKEWNRTLWTDVNDKGEMRVTISMIILFAEKDKWLYISLCIERYLEEYNDIYQTVGIRGRGSGRHALFIFSLLKGE